MTKHDNSDLFGGCPMCGRLERIHNAGRGHWGVCNAHRTRWFIGSNLFSGWRDETEAEQRHAHDVDPGWGRYEEVAA